ncbi:MAG: B-box zinc finger protein [Armatimonadota bacterium]
MPEVSTPIPETIYCARHPKQETAISCASCGIPICPRCMVVTPVGMKCPGCGKNANSGLFKVKPERLILAGMISILTGCAAALISNLGFFMLFLGIPFGYYAGSIILKSAGMKRGWKLEVTSAVGIIIGALGFRLFPGILTGHISLLPILMNPMLLIGITITVAAVISKIRYL